MIIGILILAYVFIGLVTYSASFLSDDKSDMSGIILCIIAWPVLLFVMVSTSLGNNIKVNMNKPKAKWHKLDLDFKEEPKK